MKNIFKFFSGFILLLIIFTCSDEAPATISNTDTYKISGTLKTKNPAAATHTAYFRLLRFQEEMESTPLYIIKSTVFIDILGDGVMTATYSYNDIARGRYDTVIFIDMNDNADVNSPLPDAGDLYIKTSFIFNDKDIEFNVNNTQWLTY